MSRLKPYLLRFHRWIALIFALPLAVVFATGLILSFEPAISVASVKPGQFSAEGIDALLRRVDPESKARSLAIRPSENAVAVSMVGRPGGAPRYDVTTGERIETASPLSAFFGSTRRIHETLLLDGRLVEVSTVAMLVLVVLGVLMGWWRLTNSVSGWHRAAAWLPLPVVVASPLTGLFIAWGVTFAGPSPAPSAPPPLREAMRIVAAEKDLSSVVWIRSQGGRLVARLWDGAELRAYAVTQSGLQPLPRNWPRLIHEGNWAGAWSAGLNVLVSICFVILLTTGLLIWTRRTFRRRKRTQRTHVAPASV
jgi:uncharacterized iron-regulated membrane protein